MIFDLEGKNSDRYSPLSSRSKEAPHNPRHRIRPRSSTGQGGLPASLSTLRPISLLAYAPLQVRADITKEESTLRTTRRRPANAPTTAHQPPSLVDRQCTLFLQNRI
jgi:hypothetical protein